MDDLLLLDAELIVALEAAKAAIEQLYQLTEDPT
jgi:hypothetical protein